MSEHLSWSTVDEALDRVEESDRAGIVAVFLEHEGRALDERDMRGARRTVCVSSFCQHTGIGRQTFSRWLRDYSMKETA